MKHTDMYTRARARVNTHTCIYECVYTCIHNYCVLVHPCITSTSKFIST